MNAIDKLLSNEKYAGHVLLFKTFSAKQFYMISAPKTCPNKGESATYLCVKKYTVIIPEDVFNAVQAEKQRRTNIDRTDGGTKRRGTRYSVKHDAIVRCATET